MAGPPPARNTTSAISPSSSVSPAVQRPPGEPSNPSETEREESTSADSTPWPGSDFKLRTFLPDSVYPWACNEPLPEGNVCCVSRSQAVAAWVILIAQAICYAGLWYVSGYQLPADSQPSSWNMNSSETTVNYSIVAIAGAMYLILSTAAVDVWCGCALVLEGRGSGYFKWFTWRRDFGVCLLITFIALFAASMNVLFYSADDNVNLVIGAAAVLFIAEVDEKVLLVLKNVSVDWVLFWVLQVIGLSFGLALLAVKITGNGEAVDDEDNATHYSYWTEGGCFIFSADYIIRQHPTIVTVFASLLTNLILVPTTSLPGRIIFPRSRKWLVITLFIICWVAQALLWLFHSVASTWFDTFSGGCALIFFVIFYRRQLTRSNCGQYLRQLDPQGGRNILVAGVLVVLLRMALDIWLDTSSNQRFEILYTIVINFIYFADLAIQCTYLIYFLWIMNGLRLANLRSADHDSDVALLPFLRPMLLGWGLSEGFSALTYWVFLGSWEISSVPDDYPDSRPEIGRVVWAAHSLLWLLWQLLVGKALWSESGKVRGVAYWTAASLIRTVVVEGVSTWVTALNEHSLK